MSQDPDSLEKERELREHEQEAREREPAERGPAPSEDRGGDEPAPPGTVPSTTGQP